MPPYELTQQSSPVQPYWSQPNVHPSVRPYQSSYLANHASRSTLEQTSCSSAPPPYSKSPVNTLSQRVRDSESYYKTSELSPRPMDPYESSVGNHNELHSTDSVPEAFTTTELEEEHLPSASTEDERVVQQIVDWIPARPQVPMSKMTPLPQGPVAIPQVDVNTFRAKMPYLRAYSPVLQSHDVQVDKFLAFIDNLAVAQAASPPLQVLQITGMGIGFVPHHWAQLASGGIGLAAGAATAAVSAVRTKRYMERVNREYFEPRGLKATLCKDDELQSLVRLPISAPRLASLNECAEEPTIRARRLKALSGYIAPLTLDVPAPAAQTKILDKISAKQINFTIARNQKKAAEAREKELRDENKRHGRRERKSHRKSTSPLREAYHQPQDYERTMRALELRVRQIELEAEQKILSNGPTGKKAREIEEHKQKDISKVENEIERLKVHAEFETLNVDPEWRGSVTPGGRSGNARLREHDSKHAEKDAKAVSKLGWIVIDNLRQ